MLVFSNAALSFFFFLPSHFTAAVVQFCELGFFFLLIFKLKGLVFFFLFLLLFDFFCSLILQFYTIELLLLF